jgi:hypothetical protein
MMDVIGFLRRASANTIERIKLALAAFERQTGRVPTIFQLAVNLSLNAEEVRRVIRTFLSNEKSEGSSAFKASLLEVLLGEQMWTSSPTSPYFVNHKNYLSVPSVRLIDETGAQLESLAIF